MRSNIKRLQELLDEMQGLINLLLLQAPVSAEEKQQQFAARRDLLNKIEMGYFDEE